MLNNSSFIIYIIIFILLPIKGIMAHQSSEIKSPEYIVADIDNDIPSVLVTSAKELTFPLNQADIKDIKILETKFDSETNMAGLAGPQIGIAKKIIIFAAQENPQLKKWRPDFTQFMPKTIWINPSYEGIEEEGFNEDYEGCFSVKELTGPVLRYKKIKYKAYDIDGNLVEGKAEGFLARMIQHEIDHVNGKLFIYKVPAEKRLPIEIYREKRRKAMEAEEGSK